MSSSSGLGPPGADTASTRPRNRRPNATSNTPSASVSTSESTSTFGSSRFQQTDAGGQGSSSRTGSGAGVAGLLSPTASAWVPSWSSIHGFATTLLASDGSSSSTRKTHKVQAAWGPAPPGEVSAPSSAAASARPRLQDVASGQTASREAELKARRTASVLESHPGVNGGLDVRGKFKRRTSDENLRGSASEAGAEDCLAYVHRVTENDTFFGIVLKYRCREDAFRKANGLWSRDNIQIRKWVVLPVDSCEIKGSPCDDPSLFPQGVDLLAQTPRSQQQLGPDSGGTGGSGYFDLAASGTSGKGTAAGPGVTVARSTPSESLAGESPWTHVRWVRLESCPDPVEIVRMSRNALGYFPPRRKKSIRSSVSTLSTPRASLDGLASSSLPDRTVSDSPHRSGSRHPSFLSSSGSRAAALGTSSLSSSPSRYVGGAAVSKADGTADPRPEWMRRPGGVGSMSKNVRAPGPARDPLNKWTTRHLPGFNIESLPSMSVLGSETAHFGFGDESANIVESAAEDGRDATLLAPKDTSLDKAAAAIEMWVRGAFTKGSNTPSQAAAGSVPSSSFAERIGRRLEETLGDLIELEDGPGEDGPRDSSSKSGLAGTSRAASASGWHGESEGSSRGRNIASKGKKAD